MAKTITVDELKLAVGKLLDVTEDRAGLVDELFDLVCDWTNCQSGFFLDSDGLIEGKCLVIGCPDGDPLPGFWDEFDPGNSLEVEGGP